jgi:hypothetical protein
MIHVSKKKKKSPKKLSNIHTKPTKKIIKHINKPYKKINKINFFDESLPKQLLLLFLLLPPGVCVRNENKTNQENHRATANCR